MQSKLAGVVMAAVIPLVAGCTSVKTKPVATAPESVNGLPYFLPMRTFDIDAKFVIASCAADGDKAVLTYDVKPTVKTQVVADRSRMFVIEKGIRGGALKAIDFNFQTYENGTLKSVNAIHDDRTAQTATNILSGGLKLALGAARLTGFSATTEKPKPALITLDAIAEEKNAAKKKSMTDKLRSACSPRVVTALEKVRQLTGEYDGAIEAQQKKAKLTAATEAAAKAVTDARTALKAAKEAGASSDVTLAEKDLAEAVEGLIKARAAAATPLSNETTTALSQRIAMIVDRDLTFATAAPMVPKETEEADTLNFEIPAAALQARGIQSDAPMTGSAVLQVLHSGLTPQTDLAVPALKLDGAKRQRGIYFRVPATAKLRICAVSCANVTDVSPTVRFDEQFSVPQKGQLALVPLRALMFSRNDVKLAWAPDGNLTSFGMTSTAAAEGASQAFATAGGAVADYAKERQALAQEIATAESAAEKAELQQQLDVLDLQAKIKAAQTPPSTKAAEQAGALADLDFQIELAKRRQALLTEQRKLAELEAAETGAEQ